MMGHWVVTLPIIITHPLTSLKTQGIRLNSDEKLNDFDVFCPQRKERGSIRIKLKLIL